MPLPVPTVARKRLHTRRIVCEGFERADGLFDIEAQLVDDKDADFSLASGVRPAGEPVHDMRVRVTVDAELRVVDLVAISERVPYPGGCDTIGPAYSRLIGESLLFGFRRTLADAFGGVQGCTHLTDLLAALPTVAVQTLATLRYERDRAGKRKPHQLDRCHALESGSETVRRYYPRWFRGAA
jgi:hypothetical protein